uniref:Major facilitator superfamily (MFS) profile domain-containing protein n=1 Tax=Panagrolaimus superbus TaxID=310955 RepID=A0A914YCC2_9BILA
MSDPIYPEGRERQTHWSSIYTAAILAFLGNMQLELYFSSLWPYLQEIDKTTTEKFLGLLIAAWGLGGLLSSPMFGHLSARIQKIKPLLYIGFSIMLLGNLVYVFTGVIPFGKKYLILITRFTTGFGLSYTSLLRAYAVAASIPADRSKAIAYVTGGMTLGSFIGPALQLIFTPLGRVGIRIIGDLHFNIYTGPAILACFINLAAYFLIYFCFTEKNIGVIDKNTAKEKGVDLPPYCRIAVAVCYLTTFTQYFVIIVIGILNAPFVMAVFGLTNAQTVKYTALSEFLRCFVAFLTYVIYMKYDFAKRLNSRRVSFLAIVGFLVYHLVTYSWSFLPGKLKMYSEDEILFSNGTELTGCNVDKYRWCDSLNPINFYVYYAAFIIIIGIANPNLNVSFGTLFSKIIGPRPQTIEQGWLQVAGTSGRMLGSVSMSTLESEYGPKWVWNVQIALLVLTISSWIILKHKMVPLSLPEEYAEFLDPNDPDIIKKKKKSSKKTILSE